MEELLLSSLYRNRNAIERMFGRLKDFRRIATRYDRNANNFLAAGHPRKKLSCASTSHPG
jgi:transposase